MMHTRKQIALSLLTLSLLSTALADNAMPAETKPNEYIKPNIVHDAYGTMNIVVPITTEDKNIHGMKLRNIGNTLKAMEAWKGDANIVIVLYSKGVALLKNPDEKTQQQIDAYVQKGVRIKVCDNSLREQGIDFHNLYHVTEADIVPSGFAEVAYLQTHQHFFVDPSN